MRIVVVGAGWFGACGALALRRRGHDVVLLDPGPLPRPSPDAASVDHSRAVRMDYGSDGFYAEHAARALSLWREWNRRWGESVYVETGFLIAAAGALEEPGYEGDSWRYLRTAGRQAERLSRDALHRRWPHFAASAWTDGYWQPEAGFARTGRALTLLLGDAAQAGVTLVGGARVARLCERGGRIAGVETRQGARYEGDVVVVAAGAWTPGLLPQLDGSLRATAQTVLYLRPVDPAPFGPEVFPVWAFDIARAGWYGFPATPDGLVKVAHHGAGRPQAPDDRTPDPELEGRARAFLRGVVPALADAPLAEIRACFYCDSLDGDFWIGSDPEHPGLVVASGGSGHAAKFAPLLGDWVADAAEGRSTPALRRFGWRRPRRGTERARAER